MYSTAIDQRARATEERFGVLDVLRQVWGPLDEGDLSWTAQLGDQDRLSRGTRYIVKRGREPVCCVKELPLAGPFDTAAIVATQRGYAGLRKVRVPKVLGCTQDARSWFIVEEYVPDGVRLDDAVRSGAISRAEAENLIGEVLRDISGTALGNVDPKVDERRISAAFTNSHLAERQKASIREWVFDQLSNSRHGAVWTSRDFLPRNILLSHGRPYLVDFDLACRTGLLGIDVLRTEFYTGWRIPFWPAESASHDDSWLQLLFFILEEELQRTIVGGSHYRKWIEVFDPEMRKLAAKLSPANKPARREVRAGIRPGISAIARDIGKAKVRIRRTWLDAEPREVKYHLESLGEWDQPDRPTIVSGWCFSTEDEITAVRAVVNGEAHAAFYGGRRPDVMRTWSERLATPNVGFWVRCPVCRGFNNVRVEVLRAGRWTTLCRSIWRAAYFPHRQKSDVQRRAGTPVE
jgi:hypothetical protein